MTSVDGWTTLAEEPLVLVKEYSFGQQATANALVVGLPNRQLMIVSPPTGVPLGSLRALDAHGTVSALLAFNGAHHLGLPACRAAFPQATIYATARAAARIGKKAREPVPLSSIDALWPLLGEKVTVLPVDGDKLGDVLVRISSEKGVLLFAGDFIANLRSLPNRLLFRMIFKLTDSGPGLKVFRLFFRVFVKDRRAARDFLIQEVQDHPPAIVVPAHGEVVDRPNLGPTLVSMLRAAV